MNRRWQDGSFRLRSPDRKGRVGVQFRYRDPETGKMRGPIFRARDEQVALQKARRFARRVLADIERGDYAPPERGARTLAELWEEYDGLVQRGEIELAPDTAARWRSLWRRFLAPTLGGVPIGRLRRSHIRGLAARIKAPRVRGQTISLIRMLLYRALEDEEIRANPAAHWRLTKAETGEPEGNELEPFTAQELDAVAEEIRIPYRAMVYVQAYGIMRFSEVSALELPDVDWLRRRVRIDEKLVEVAGELHFGRPKTPKSNRWAYLPAWVMDELSQHVRCFPPNEVACPDGRARQLLFTSPGGGPVRRGNFVKRIWKPALERAGLTHRDLDVMHLRHTGGSLAHEAGAQQLDLQDMLGHTSARMAGRYVRLYADRKQRIADAMGKLARPRRKGSLRDPFANRQVAR